VGQITWIGSKKLSEILRKKQLKMRTKKMPKVGKKSFPYTEKGKVAAVKYAKKLKPKKKK
jgi:hypothetical protein